MFKAPDHQVAGHQAHNGTLGPLIDDSGRFYKPLQDGDRGKKEQAFYSLFCSNRNIPAHIRGFFPRYYGIRLLKTSNGSGIHPYLVLEDIVSNLQNPSVMDIKMGSRTWYLQASENYIKKSFKKDQESTSQLFGFKISGLQTYESRKSSYWKPDRMNVVKNYNGNDTRLALRKFVSSNPSSESEPDCLYAKTIYGGSNGILAQLLILKEWLEDQTMYHFNSCSILMVYENGVGEEGKRRKWSGGKIKLVDFAHVMDGDGVIDLNFLGGLCSLIKFISDILISLDNKFTIT